MHTALLSKATSSALPLLTLDLPQLRKSDEVAAVPAGSPFEPAAGAVQRHPGPRQHGHAVTNGRHILVLRYKIIDQLIDRRLASTRLPITQVCLPCARLAFPSRWLNARTPR